MNLGAPAALGDVTVGPVEAATDFIDDTTGRSASALASVSGVSIPTGATGMLKIVGPAQATAAYACENGAVQGTAASTLHIVQLGGQTIDLPSGSSDTIQLGGGSYIALNQDTKTSTSITEQLVHVHLNGLADVVVGEATVTQPGANACAGATAGGGAGSGGGGTRTGTGGGAGEGSVCPRGSTLVPSSEMCEIITSGSGADVRGITVSAPGADSITGARVLSLRSARKRFGARTACLTGKGPHFVVVGTKKADRIRVRKIRTRVLGLGGNDHIMVQGGNRTCVNGGAGNDVILNKAKNRVTVFGANGKDRITLGNGPAFVLGGKGNDRIIAGNGRVNLQGNAGKDYLKAGNGTDRLNGGSGNDTLIAGSGTDRLNGGPGNNRLTARGRKAFVQAGKGSSTAYLRKPNMGYAKRHGVHTVHPLTR